MCRCIVIRSEASIQSLTAETDRGRQRVELQIEQTERHPCPAAAVPALENSRAAAVRRLAKAVFLSHFGGGT